MGSNYYTPWSDGSTTFRTASMDPALAALDKAITYGTKKPIVHCDGVISYAAGVLAWSGTIRIVFNRADGQAILNTIASGSITLADNEFAYTTLSETDSAAITVAKAAISTGAASNWLTLGIFVLAIRNVNDDINFVGLPVRPLLIQNEGSALNRREQLNFTGLSVTASDDAGNNRTNVAIRSGIPDASIVSYTDPISIDLDSYNVADITLTGSPTINFTGGVDGQKVVLRLRQDGTGNRTVTWGSMVRFSTDIPSPTLSTSPGALDYLEFRYNDLDVSGGSYDLMLVNRGF